jgi:L-threonylcarbamoyladenylate synthase
MMHQFKDQFDGIIQDLQGGKVILMPTDTIWGMVCDARNTEAIKRIYALKGLQTGSGLVSMVSDVAMLKQYVPNLHPRIETLLLFHKRPLTVLYAHTQDMHEVLQGPDKTVAIRLTFDPICLKLIEALGGPIVASAACTHDSPYPTHFGEIRSDILSQVDYIMKYRQDDRRPFVPSVIARMGIDEELEFVRE